MVQKLERNAINSVFEGVVVQGNQVGRQLGFPTANIHIQSGSSFPTLSGVYSVKVFYSGEYLDGVMNIGVKPTFKSKSKEKTFEVHILDFEGHLYDEILHIEICHYIRNERKFKTIDALKKQLVEDCKIARLQLQSISDYVRQADMNMDTDIVHLPDLDFVRFCQEKFSINRGIYNTIDKWFSQHQVQNIVQRRTVILRFLYWVTVYLPSDRKIEFGMKGLTENLNCYYSNYVSVN